MYKPMNMLLQVFLLDPRLKNNHAGFMSDQSSFDVTFSPKGYQNPGCYMSRVKGDKIVTVF